MDRFSGLKFSDIKNSNITDNHGNKIGRLLDAVFKQSEDGLHLTKFTIGGSVLEEMMEDMGLKEDVDPVFPVDVIEGVAPTRIRLNVAKSQLKSTTINDDAISHDEIKLSTLSKFKILDGKNEHIGNIIDLKFVADTAHFIIGDGFMLELLEDVGLRPDIDLLVDPYSIDKITDDGIILNRNKIELEEIFEKYLPGFKRIDIVTEEDQSSITPRTIYFPKSSF